MCNEQNVIGPIERLTKDLKEAARILSDAEARFIVDAYYIMQEDRKRLDNQLRSLRESGEPNDVIIWLAKQSSVLEAQIAMALDKYSASNPVSQWARNQYGIGPIISAGLLAHVHMDFCKTAGDLWHFAGLDPTAKWEKGKKRPWNATLKALCWNMGECFVKVSGNPNAFYGQIYAKRKEYELARNERGDLAEQAAKALRDKNYRKDTDAYKAYSVGKLPPAHIHARAKRYAVKFFLSHYWEIAYRHHYKEEPPAIYSIGHLHHVDYIPPPL